MVTIILNILIFVFVIISIVAHEISHGYVANYFGDDTAKSRGRLSLNPIRHIDPVGTIIFPLLLRFAGSPVVFGWAKPVPINPYYMRNRERSMALVSLAGPVTNIILALCFAFSANSLYLFMSNGIFIPLNTVFLLLYKSMIWAIIINLFLAFFNLIPVPPLDGSRIVRYFLPRDLKDAFDKIERFGILILFLLLFYFDGLFQWIQNIVAVIINILLINPGI